MGSPVGGGVAIFMAFAAAYAGWEYYKSRKKEDTV
jgi:UDP-N-acetylmuramyl pentapeptide phosphotransferase/UDP-N-acetylglucosamine-1-phosphate transferase